MAQFRNISNVRRLPGEPGCYIVDLELDLGDGEGFAPATGVMRPAGGGICDDVLAEISSGNFAGEIVDYAPPTVSAHETPLTQSQWIFALEANDLYAPLETAIQAQPAATRAGLRSLAFHKQQYPYSDVLGLIALYAPILPVEITGLSEAQLQAMWAHALESAP